MDSELLGLEDSWNGPGECPVHFYGVYRHIPKLNPDQIWVWSSRSSLNTTHLVDDGCFL